MSCRKTIPHDRRTDCTFLIAAALLTIAFVPSGWAGEIHKAAKMGDAALVESAILNGAKVDAPNLKTWDLDLAMRPLHYAAESGSIEVVGVLLQHGANVNIANTYFETPLHTAARAGQLDVLKKLIAAGAMVNARDAIARTPLHWAAHRGDEAAAEWLLENAASNAAKCQGEPPPAAPPTVQVTAPAGSTLAILQAVQRNAQNQLYLAVQQKRAAAGEFARSFWGRKPVEVAKGEGHQDVVALLEWRSGRTPLHDAAGRGGTEEIDTLLLAGADVNARIRGYRWTPLHYAAAKDQLETVNLLLERGAEVDAMDNRRWTALHHAARSSRLEMMRDLLAAGANVGASTLEGLTPLHLAAVNGDRQVGELLIHESADASAATDDGWTPLHSAAKHGQREFALLLLEGRASVNAKDDAGETPLHWAAQHGQTDIAELLLSYGAEVNARNNNGKTALKLAKKNPQKLEKHTTKAVINLLKSSGARG